MVGTRQGGGFFFLNWVATHKSSSVMSRMVSQLSKPSATNSSKYGKSPNSSKIALKSPITYVLRSCVTSDGLDPKKQDG